MDSFPRLTDIIIPGAKDQVRAPPLFLHLSFLLVQFQIYRVLLAFEVPSSLLGSSGALSLCPPTSMAENERMEESDIQGRETGAGTL